MIRKRMGILGFCWLSLKFGFCWMGLLFCVLMSHEDEEWMGCWDFCRVLTMLLFFGLNFLYLLGFVFSISIVLDLVWSSKALFLFLFFL